MKKSTLKKLSAFIIAAMMFSANVNAQAPSINWQKCVGGSKDEYSQSIIKLADGNYLICGTTKSTDGDFNANHGSYDAFLMKTDGAGNIIWKKTYGGSKYDVFEYAMETSNGDLYAIGTTASNDGQVSGNHGAAGTNDVWLVKTNRHGKLLSQHCYGGSGDEAIAYKLIMSTQGNLVFVSQTNSTDGDVSNNHGDYDGWVVKLNSTFGIEWAVTIGDTAYEDFSGIDENNGDFVVTGTRASRISSTPNLENYYDSHAAKLDQSGNIIWYRIYGGTRSDDCNFSVQSVDGNQVLTGHTSSNDGDVSTNNGFNMWVWKIDVANGNIMWQNYFGEPNDTAASFRIVAIHDGGFVLCGAIAPNEELPLKTWDAYCAKVDENGNALWTKRFGGSKYDGIDAGVEEPDGSILLAGDTKSNNGDVSGNHGGPEDVWLVNLSGCGQRSVNPDETISITEKSFITVYPNPVFNSTTISFSLNEPQNVSLRIFDVSGKFVSTIANINFEAGENQVEFNAEKLNTGIYILCVQTT